MARFVPSTPIIWARQTAELFADRRLGRRGRWILLAMLIGSVSGVGAILFDVVFHWCSTLLIQGIGRFSPPGSGIEGGAGYGPEVLWLLPVSLVIGGLISGALVFGLAPEAEGHGTDAVIKSFHHLRGKIRRRVAPLKALTSAITIGSGGSAGREGPIAQIGAGFGSWLADLLKLGNHDRRIMVMAGVAGGVGSIFRAPLGAALFSAEVLYSKPEFEYEVLLPGLISAITGYTIYSSYAGFGYLFDVPRVEFHDAQHLLTYAGLGIACAALGALYPRMFYGTRDGLFRRLPVPRWLQPAIGAALLGLLGMVFPEVLGMGYGYVQQAIDGHHGIAFLLVFAWLKMLATSLTISSGGSGGVFGPSLVVGGALGAAFGQAAQMIVPAAAPEPWMCVMVGMGGFFAGVAKTPFAAVIMVMEMTGSYGLLVPSLLVATIAYLLLPLGTRLYENQVGTRTDSPAHLGSLAVDVLRHVRVRDCWNPPDDGVPTVRRDTPLRTLLEAASNEQRNLLPVVDDDGRLVGELSIDDLRRAVVERESASDGVAGDLMRAAVGPLVPQDTLAVAARLLAGRRTDTLTVVESQSSMRVIGTYTRRDLIRAYGESIDRLGDSRDSVPAADPF